MADLNFRLNAQGPRGPQGPQGEKGEDGITPLFYEGINNATTYTLNIDYGDGNVSSTGNLRPPTVNNGGTYVRYDNVDNVYSLTTPDYADLNHNPGEVILLNADDYTNGDPEELEGYAVSGQFITEVINTMNTEFSNVNDAIELKADKSTTYTKTETNTLLNGKANTVHTHTLSQITDAGSLAGKSTVNYNTDITNKPILGSLAAKNTVDYATEVTNKPTIPTVGNATITITQGGVIKGSFTTNQSSNGTISLDAGGGGGTTYTAGNAIDLTSDTISVKVDGTTIGLNASNQLELKATIPDVSHMVTDNTAQTISAKKTFADDIVLNGTKCIYYKNSMNNECFMLGKLSSNVQGFGHISVGYVQDTLKLVGKNARPTYTPMGGTETNIALYSDIKTVKKKTITQASANVSESSGTVTVTDSDVTTSTIVNLYPTDSTTETWLENNLSSTIITESTGSFTFDISSSLPSTWSMYYTITEVI